MADPRAGDAPAAPGALRGPRVELRPPRASDREAVVALARASVRFHRGRATPPRTAAAFARYLTRTKAPDLEPFLIVRRADGAILGALEISRIVMGPFRSAYLGYWIGAPYAGQGWMTEALPLALRHAFRTLGLHRVEANVQPGNEASIALLRRAGFTCEGYSARYLKIGGRWRDHERWALLKEEWRPGRG